MYLANDLVRNEHISSEIAVIDPITGKPDRRLVPLTLKAANVATTLHIFMSVNGTESDAHLKAHKEKGIEVGLTCK